MTRAHVQLLLASLTSVLAGCAGSSNPTGPATDSSKAPLFEGLGTHRRPVATASAEAQRFFDQGLVFYFAFMHAEAIRSFREAARLDPSCAMAWWGIALASGPHINFPAVEPEPARVAWEAVQKAVSLSAASSGAERDLIAALAKRYSADFTADRRPLDEAYANAMREVWRAHPKDADAGALFAEALMDLRPWDLWTRDGQPQPGTDEIVATLEAVLALDSGHPGALHFHIHAVEASPHPERALSSADRLAGAVPAASHLVHMPSHIYARLGRWADAAAANDRAMAASRAYLKVSPQHGFYLVYAAHNAQFLAWTAMMEGRSAVALKAAREMLATIPAELAKERAPIIDGFLSIAVEAMVRFGKWDEVLREPEPPAHALVSRAMRLHARAVALAALGRLDEAVKEKASFETAAANVPEEFTVGNTPSKTILELAKRFLAGEVLFRQGQLEKAAAELKEAAAIEDGIRYDEPPDWLIPARHALGAVLLAARKPLEAEAVYREDLVRNPENGWALFGLTKALRARGADAEAAQVEARFKKAWARSDVTLSASCFCAAGG